MYYLPEKLAKRHIACPVHPLRLHLCQLVFATTLWEKNLEMFVTLLSLKYALTRGPFLKLII